MPVHQGGKGPLVALGGRPGQGCVINAVKTDAGTIRTRRAVSTGPDTIPVARRHAKRLLDAPPQARPRVRRFSSPTGYTPTSTRCAREAIPGPGGQPWPYAPTGDRHAPFRRRQHLSDRPPGLGQDHPGTPAGPKPRPPFCRSRCPVCGSPRRDHCRTGRPGRLGRLPPGRGRYPGRDGRAKGPCRGHGRRRGAPAAKPHPAVQGGGALSPGPSGPAGRTAHGRPEPGPAAQPHGTWAQGRNRRHPGRARTALFLPGPCLPARTPPRRIARIHPCAP
ncbi:Basic proline-rich protein precursor [Desulfovibrio sp. DV]|nr:Basic proline-rich protein precursor [Desulfovibrio sp. DV]